MASIVYWEQVGWKRHRGGKRGDTRSWYKRMIASKTAFTSLFLPDEISETMLIVHFAILSLSLPYDQ